MAFFLSRKSKVDRSRVLDWLALSSCDGEVHENEQGFIAALAARHGVAEKDWNAVVNKPDSVKPSEIGSDEQQVEHLFDLVHIMLADGEIHETEMDIVKSIAARLGFPSSTIDKMTAVVLHAHQEATSESEDIEVADDELKDFLKA